MIPLLLIFIAICGFIAAILRLFRVRRETNVLPRPVLGGWTNTVANVLPTTKDGRSKLAKDLVRSGYPHEVTRSNFLATRNISLIAWIVFAAILVVFELIEPSRFALWTFVAICALIVGLPRVILSLQANSRTQRISGDLPDALDLLAMTMRGGMTMKESLSHLIGEFDSTHQELASELKILARQAEKGSLDDALVAFADRLDVPEVTALTSMLRGGHRSGGSMADTLRGFSDELRHYRDQRARQRGNQASIKLLLPVVFCLAPPIYILLLGPAFLDLKNFIEKENQPGGVLVPAVQAQRDLGTTRITR